MSRNCRTRFGKRRWWWGNRWIPWKLTTSEQIDTIVERLSDAIDGALGVIGMKAA